MIRLVVNGVTLPVPEGLSFTRSFDTTIFNREKEVTDFTYPVDFPLTDEVIAGLGFINSLATPNIKRSFTCDFYVNESYIDQVTLNILNVSLSKRIMTANISGVYGTFAKLIGDIEVSSLDLGGIRTVGTVNTGFESYSVPTNGSNTAVVNYYRCTTAAHMKSVVTGATAADYTFPTAADLGMNLPYTHDDATINILNGWDFYNSLYIDPIWAYIMDRWNNNDVDSGFRYWWVPMFYCHYVLRKCFEEAGFTVSGNFFTDPQFTKILLYNTYAINQCSRSVSQTSTNTWTHTIKHNATTIDPRNHVPKMKVIDFITELCKYLNLKLDIDLVNLTVGVNALVNGVADFSFVDLSDIVTGEPEIAFEQQDYQAGFEFSHTYDSADSESGASSDMTLYDQNLKAIVTNADIALGPSVSFVVVSYGAMTEGDIYYMRRTDSYDQRRNGEDVFYANNQQGYRTGTGDTLLKVNTLFVPVKPVNRLFMEWVLAQTSTGTFFERITCPQSGIGICGINLLYIQNLKDLDSQGLPHEAVGVTAKTEIVIQPHVVNWLGFAEFDTPGKTYPYASCNPYTPLSNGGYANTISLNWYNPEGWGVAQRLWKPFTDMVKNGVLVKWQVKLDIVKYLNINWNKNGIRMHGQNYLVKKADLVYPFPAISTLTLVRV